MEDYMDNALFCCEAAEAIMEKLHNDMIEIPGSDNPEVIKTHATNAFYGLWRVIDDLRKNLYSLSEEIEVIE